MIRAGILFAAFAASLAVSPARACEPAEVDPRRKAVQYGDNCSASWFDASGNFISIGETQAIGPGFAMQQLSATACGGITSFAVHDCAAGKSLVIQNGFLDFYDEAGGKRLDRLQAKLARQGARKNPDLDDFQRIAEQHGVVGIVTVLRGGTIEFGGRPVRFDCACKTLFPQMGGQG